MCIIQAVFINKNDDKVLNRLLSHPCGKSWAKIEIET